EVSGIDDPQTATLRLLVDSNLTHAVADAHLADRDRYRHAFADQPPRHGVAVRIDLDGAIVADDAAQLPQPSERRPPAERPQSVRLVTLEAANRRLASRAVDTHVRHITLPLGEMRLEGLPAREGMPRDRILLHVADAVLCLALRARPIGRAGARTE